MTGFLTGGLGGGGCGGCGCGGAGGSGAGGAGGVGGTGDGAGGIFSGGPTSGACDGSSPPSFTRKAIGGLAISGGFLEIHPEETRAMMTTRCTVNTERKIVRRFFIPGQTPPE
ncbi:MAG: hypothetical protein E7041_03410 [Lentisphaerae bacterium]|nr:hypothetical protein [Lentisphaerota bacterium]